VLLNLKPILAFALALTVGSAPAGERIVWKPLENAVLKVDERPAKVWNVYRAEKKDHLLLVTLGRRFLMLDIKGREIYELDPTKFEQKNNELLWHEADKPARPLPTADWVVRDAGRARRIRVRLADEGRVLEVQVPITQDFRSVY
jgi:hypothetical protein